jgi:predicted nucleic acid-binding protein
MTPALVLDCSVAMSWCFADEASPAGQAVQERLVSESAVVPAHWHLEVINVLAMAERRKRIAAADSNQFLRLLGTFDIEVDVEASARAFAHLLPLCRSHGLTSYDAAYLDLALRRGLPLAKLDGELRAAASDLGEIETSGPVTLEPRGGRYGKLVAATVFAVIWNTIVGIVAVMALKDGAGLFALFLVPFVLAGVAVVGIAVHSALALFNPRVVLTLSRPAARPGERLTLTWGIEGRRDALPRSSPERPSSSGSRRCIGERSTRRSRATRWSWRGPEPTWTQSSRGRQRRS